MSKVQESGAQRVAGRTRTLRCDPLRRIDERPLCGRDFVHAKVWNGSIAPVRLRFYGPRLRTFEGQRQCQRMGRNVNRICTGNFVDNSSPQKARSRGSMRLTVRCPSDPSPPETSQRPRSRPLFLPLADTTSSKRRPLGESRDLARCRRRAVRFHDGDQGRRARRRACGGSWRRHAIGAQYREAQPHAHPVRPLAVDDRCRRCRDGVAGE